MDNYDDNLKRFEIEGPRPLPEAVKQGFVPNTGAI